MVIKSDNKVSLWMAIGAVLLLIVILLVWHFQTSNSPAEELAYKANRVDLVAKIRLNLSSASEAEKSSVMAITDKESQTFADQARKATNEIEQELEALDLLLKSGGTSEEKELFNQISEAFSEFQKIDNELLAMAVKNTNIKALNLTFGPATDDLNNMDQALSQLITKVGKTPEAKDVALLVYGLQNSFLRIQVLLPKHIAEESETEMDKYENLMNIEDNKARLYLDSLTLLNNLKENNSLKTAMLNYSKYNELRKQIIGLSRENSNVKSLTISLGQKRQIFLQCQELLSSLQQVIMNESIPGVNYGNMTNPRSLEGNQ